MNTARLIARKRDRHELTDDEIGVMIRGFATGQIPDYQMAAWAMAVFLNGMTDAETASLTQHMLNSGKRLTWTADGRPVVDKHSTGGVGDKISIPLAPLMAACGLRVPMISGRGLGPTGGTLDKLESIPGFRTDLTLAEMTRQTNDIGCVITGASPELAPADRRLYALRDVTGTVPSVPLITASIMSKKLAESPDALVLDVKFGSGAFMKTAERAGELAHSLVQTGHRAGVRTIARMTDMNQPLGRMCGNTVEILESMDILKGKGPPDVRELTLLFTADALVRTELESDMATARKTAEAKLDDGSALRLFERMVEAQGGRLHELTPPAERHEITADRSGFLSAVDTEAVGYLIIGMGGGRTVSTDRINHAVGIEMSVRIGDKVEIGQPLANVFSEDLPNVDGIRSALTITEAPVPSPPLIIDEPVT